MNRPIISSGGCEYAPYAARRSRTVFALTTFVISRQQEHTNQAVTEPSGLDRSVRGMMLWCVLQLEQSRGVVMGSSSAGARYPVHRLLWSDR